MSSDVISLVSLALFAVSVATCPLVFLFVMEVLFSLRWPAVQPPVEAPNFTVIVPAHNEAEVIEYALQSILPQLRQDDRLLVVADNCSDNTAEIAAAWGANVTCRDDRLSQGKGYALAYGHAYAKRWANPVTMFVDADCYVSEGALCLLAAEAWRTGQPVQGNYQLLVPRLASVAARYNSFAIRTKNYVRLLGCTRLRIPCTLTGSGMAFPRAALEQIELASGEIVEDLLLAVKLAIAGRPARFCPEAAVTSPLPQTAATADQQRARWEQGKLSVTRRFAGRLLALGLRRGDRSLFLLGLDLAIPPLSLLALLLGTMLIATVLWVLLGGGLYPLISVALQVGLFVAAVAAAWFWHARDLLATRELLTLPLLIIKKLAFYGRLLRTPRMAWVRTTREIAGQHSIDSDRSAE